MWFNKHFTEMLSLVLSTPSFYFSYTFDITHSLQWLAENATPQFAQTSLLSRVRNLR